MSQPPSKVAERARALLEKKEAILPGVDRLQQPSQGSNESTADAFLSVLVEAAFLVAAADGVVSEAEKNTLAETISYTLGGELPPGELGAMIDAFAEVLASDGRAQRLTVMARSLPDAPARREALAFAALIALCDRELVSAEREVLDLLGASFGLDQDAVRDVINAVADGLAS